MANRNLLGGFALLIVAAAAIAWRLVNYRYVVLPDAELMTSVALGAAAFTRSKIAVLAPLSLVVLTDAFIGMVPISAFTWSAWLITGAISIFVRRGNHPVLRASVLGGVTSIAFYLWTNFGVWVESAGHWYTFDVAGLIESYVAGLPFLRTMFVLNLVLPALVVGVISWTKRRAESMAERGFENSEGGLYDVGRVAFACYLRYGPSQLRYVVTRIRVVLLFAFYVSPLLEPSKRRSSAQTGA